ncbi:hypothetical protein BJ742DRAFT_839428 [Cladochytrium replicatum]|nr:hypothetical protein BJ742DRAFT_839428 [Cladochytrium replicatum]
MDHTPVEPGSLTTLWDRPRRKHGQSPRRWSIPLTAFIGMFLFIVLALAIVPTAVIVFTTSITSIDSLVEKVIKDTVVSAVKGLSNYLNGISTSTVVFLRSNVARTFLSTQTRGYGNNSEFNYLAIQLVQSTPWMVNLICGQANNVTGEVPSTWYTNHDYPNGTSYLVDVSSTVFYADYSTGDLKLSARFDNETGKLIGLPPQDAGPISSILKYGAGFRMMESGQCEAHWISEIVPDPLFTFAACADPMNVTDVFGHTKRRVPYACSSVTPIAQASRLLKDLSPTPGTRLLLMDADGLLIASNLDITTLTEDGKRFVLAANASDVYISEISQVLSRGSGGSILWFATKDGMVWKVATEKLELRNGRSNFYFTVAIPRADFFAEVEGSIRRGIIISCVASASGLLGALAVAFLIVLPVRKMVNNMSKATHFEFRELEASLKLSRPSIFSELRTLQATFATMVMTFAAALQKQRDRVQSIETSTHC